MTGAGQTVERSESGAAEHAVVPLLEEYLESVARQTAEQLGEVAGVAITLGLGDEPVTIGASSQLALEVDLIQYEVGVGPCLHALRHDETLYVPDLAGDDRWGQYGPRAAARGAACCFSVPVRVEGRPQAVLKVYASEVDGLDAEQRRVMTEAALATSGGLALALHLSRHARELDDRAAAMDRRRTIDLALGMLMERNQVGADEAFALLKRYSQHYNTRLHEVAAQVVHARDASDTTSTAPFLRDGAS